MKSDERGQNELIMKFKLKRQVLTIASHLLSRFCLITLFLFAADVTQDGLRCLEHLEIQCTESKPKRCK